MRPAVAGQRGQRAGIVRILDEWIRARRGWHSAALGHGSGRLLLPALCHVRCLVSRGPPLRDLDGIVDALWLPGDLSPLIQQRGGTGRGRMQGMRCLRHALVRQRRTIGGLPGLLIWGTAGASRRGRAGSAGRPPRTCADGFPGPCHPGGAQRR